MRKLGYMTHTKRPHGLHLHTHPQAFLEDFEAQTGATIAEIVRIAAGTENVVGVILGGSLPLGIGTSASDIDLLVVLDKSVRNCLPKSDAHTKVLHAGTFAEAGERIVRGEVVLMRGGIEINCQILTLQAIVSAAQQLQRGHVSQTPYEFGLLSRLRTGWKLIGAERLRSLLAPLLESDALEVHCTIWYLVGATQELGDARAALEDCPRLALHLGRSAYERAVLAFLASRGFAYVGSKWLRAFEHTRRDTLLGSHAAAVPGADSAFQWLYPNNGRLGEAAAYISEVTDQLATIRAAIEKDRTYAVATAICPQL
jgi:hypothetical protein